MKLLQMFYRKIEEARQFFGFTNIYIIDTVLMMFCAFEGHTFILNKFQDVQIQWSEFKAKHS